jgi:GNAT superfamily N-acetyltransferase
MITNERALEVFVNAYCLSKSRIQPYVATRHGDLWVMRDGPGKNRYTRNIEVIAHQISPKQAVAQIRELGIRRHNLCYVHEKDRFSEIRAEFLKLRYYDSATEWLFVHDYENIPICESDPMPARIETPEQLAAIPQSVRQPRHFNEKTRMYCAWDGTGDRGWVESVPIGTTAWTANFYVFKQFRKQGYGTALMSQLLQDDKKLGCDGTVLLASVEGSKLYPRVGFEERGTLQIFHPIR